MKFNYDSESGCAYIGDSDKKVKSSIGLMNTFVVDMDFKGKVSGVEIIDANAVLKDFKIDVNKVEQVGMNVKHTDNYFAVILTFKQAGIEKEIVIPVAPIATSG